MAGPIVFISRNRVKDGKLEELREFLRTGTEALEKDKPRTLAFLAFADEAGTEVTIVHVFADAEAMDLHVQGADERSSAAYEFIEPAGFEIDGSASEAVLAMMKGAADAGPELIVRPQFLSGFLRLNSG
jgi:quinol monooxygenase YgiN